MAEKEPTWAVVLHALYEKGMAGGEFDKYGKAEIHRKQAIAEEADRDRPEVIRALKQMENQRLINRPPANRKKGYTLTKKGFDVAHTRELRRQEQRREQKRAEREQKRDKRQHGVNRAIGYLTLGLVLTGVLQMTIAAILGIGSLSLSIADIALSLSLARVLLVGYGIVVGLGVLLWKSGMLASWDSGREKEQ